MNGLAKTDALKFSLADLYAKLGTSEQGLTEKEAGSRLASSGPNVLKRKSVNALDILGRQLKSSLIYLLIGASLLAYSIHDFRDGTIILVILLINTSLGFYQEYKSEKIVEKLSRFITRQVRVRRNGQISLVDESQVVVGDILIVREGDIASADMRLIDTEDLRVNESQLTGESAPVAKQDSTGAGAKPENMLFTGSVVEKGEGVGIIYATGNDTELGVIAKLSTETKKQTQYEKSLQSFSSFLIKIVLIGLAIIFIAKFFLAHGSGTTDLLLFVIALAVGTVPEVLPVIATVTLSAGALKLAKQHVVVRRLSAMEDFGNINLLCTDKTGTITENKMVVKKVTATDEKLFQVFAYAGITPLKGRKKRTQNSYDEAFLQYASEEIKKEAGHFRILKELPFDPEDRRSRLVVENTEHKRCYLLSIGAPETLLAISGAGHKAEYLRDIAKEGGEGLHHLAIAYKEISYSDNFDILKNEHDLAFLGYASMEDPLRPSAKKTIERAERLCITIKILTGDGREVAEYVGKQIGLLKEGSKVYLGDELEAMTQDEFKAAVQRSTIFARVSPTQKFNIIKALKETNVVGYQGDGINDAPALKLADVAIAVNSATDIAKENADIVLLNKSLEVIINGIRYGRSIFVNINKYIRYTMSNNFGAFVGLSTLYLLSVNLPILPVQVLLNNLFGDIPLIMVSTDTVEDDEVVQPERHNMRELMFISLILGVPTALFEILYFATIRAQTSSVAQTSLYVFLTFQALIIFYAIRNKKHFWKAKMSSAALNISFFLAFVLSLGIIFIPQFQAWFSFVPISATAIGTIMILMLLYFLAVDYVKVWYYQGTRLGGLYTESATAGTAAMGAHSEKRGDQF